jgi:hypothetical protein
VIAQLTYRPREGILFGTVANEAVHLATFRNHAGMDPAWWRQTMQSAGTPESRVVAWEHLHEFRSSSAPPGDRFRLTIARNATLETYDYPGVYAQRFDSIDPGGGSSTNHRHHTRVVWIKDALKTSFPDSRFYLHGPPLCSSPRCIVIVQNWDSLFQALTRARQVSIVVEL